MCALCLTMQAQSKGRYCRTYNDFVENHWTEIDTVIVEHRSASQQVWSGNNDYRLEHPVSAVNKILKKEALAVEFHDTLFVNCHKLFVNKSYGFGNGYTLALRYDNTKICFANRLVGPEAAVKAGLSGFMFGAVGAAIASSSNLKNQVCYLVCQNQDKKGRTPALLMDDDFMNDLLAGHESERSRYNAVEKKKERRSAANVLPILKELELIKY